MMGKKLNNFYVIALNGKNIELMVKFGLTLEQLINKFKKPFYNEPQVFIYNYKQDIEFKELQSSDLKIYNC